MTWELQIRSARMTPTQFSEFSEGYVVEAQKRGHKVGEISQQEDRETNFTLSQVVPISDEFGAHWFHDFRLVAPRGRPLQPEARYKCHFRTNAPNRAIANREAEAIGDSLRNYLN